MNSAAFELVGGSVVPTDFDDAVRRAREGDGAFWFDVDSYTTAELEELLARLNVPPLATRIALGHGPLQQISLPRFAHVGLTVFADEAGAQLETTGAMASDTVLVTFHPTPAASPSPVPDILDEADPDSLSPSRLLILLLLMRVQQTHRVAMRLWEAQAELDERDDRNVSSVGLDQIRAQKLAVARLAEVVASLTDSFEFLAGAESEELAFSQHVGNVAQLVAAARSLGRMTERLDRSANDLRKSHEVQQQKRMTHRLNTLTVIAAIFTPLTLLAAIWGMNFENMPGLTTTYGLVAALGLMVAIAGVLLWYFRRMGWFD
jgi:magnesium transporter